MKGCGQTPTTTNCPGKDPACGGTPAAPTHITYTPACSGSACATTASTEACTAGSPSCKGGRVTTQTPICDPVKGCDVTSGTQTCSAPDRCTVVTSDHIAQLQQYIPACDAAGQSCDPNSYGPPVGCPSAYTCSGTVSSFHSAECNGAGTACALGPASYPYDCASRNGQLIQCLNLGRPAEQVYTNCQCDASATSSADRCKCESVARACPDDTRTFCKNGSVYGYSAYCSSGTGCTTKEVLVNDCTRPGYYCWTIDASSAECRYLG